MPGLDRTAEATWNGDLAGGKGTIRLRSGAAPELPVTWAARVEKADGMTSPEELIAAAHASCFSMALSHELAQKGHAPRQLDVTATCSIEKVAAGFRITRMKLSLVGDVPGLDDAAFQEAANGAKAGCPVSQALQNNVQIELDARLK